MNRNTLLLLGTFTLGCAAGLTLDSSARAQAFPQPAQTRKWQQFCELLGPGKELDEGLRKRGEEGWELVTLHGGGSLLVCFKRPAT
jgi:hypothetical protein